MALADVLRERVSRRGCTAEMACGLLGTVTVEALPPRECAALGLRDGGRALFYAACRDLQTAGETLRREGRLFTPAEVTAYVSDAEAEAAARTVLALSGVTADGDGPSTKSAEVRLGDVQNSGAHLAVEAPVAGEFRPADVQENTVQKAEVRLGDVRNDAPHFAVKAPSAREFRLAGVQENEKVRHEDVRKRRFKRRKSDLVTCGNRTVRQKMDKSHMSFSAETVQTGQTLSWVVFPILYHKILRCPRKMTDFQHLWNCPGTLRKCPGEGRICTNLSRKPEKCCTK